MEIFITIVAAALIAEFLGFNIHILLHSNRIGFLSRSHMIHHLVIYGPKVRLRSKTYISPLIDNRIGFFDIGLEWWIPAALIILLIIGIFNLLQIPTHLLIIFLVVGAVWGFFFYNYMHDAMHIEGFWMINNKALNKWFMRARHLHDVHHLEISDDGRMDRNYGICFFAFDKIFKTFQGDFTKFNESGYENAKKRYAYIYNKLENLDKYSNQSNLRND